MMKENHTLRRALALASALVVTGATAVSASEVLHWNHIAVDTTTRALPLDPITESRILAMVHVAMHDAANLVAPRYATYTQLPREDAAGASVDAAVSTAAHATLRELLPDQAAALDREFDRAMQRLADDDGKRRGMAAGRRAATRMIELRREDGSARATAYVAGQRPGEYRPTPPDFTPAFLSHWGHVQPFALSTSQQFRPAPPPAVGSREAWADLEEVRQLGGEGSKQRTFEQSEIACYWYEPSTRGWNRITRDVVVSRNLDRIDQARVFALVHMAMADGFIAGFESKYHYNYWRPATAIREAGDGAWLSYLPTPPVPDYPSTHTVLGAAAATVLARCLGTDYVPFMMTSGAPYPNITRRYWSFSQAAMENGASRVLAGLHFTRAVQAGYRQGTDIGDWVATRTLRPIEAQPTRQVAAAK